MKLIKALKKIKDLKVKAGDLKSKIHKHHVDYVFKTPVYGDQKRKTYDYEKLLDDIKLISKSVRIIAGENNPMNREFAWGLTQDLIDRLFRDISEMRDGKEINGKSHSGKIKDGEIKEVHSTVQEDV